MTVTGLLLVSLLLRQAPGTHEWTRHPAPGVEYRMIVRDEPKLVAVAVRFAPDAPYRAVTAQTREKVYDLTPTNGRATLSETVETTGAAGGVNGDFFQWGKDPCGDRVNLMVRHGELISAPGSASPGGRSLACGWGAGRFVLRSSGWHATASLGGDIGALNAYTALKGLTLSTSSAGYAISKTPATFVVLDVGPRVLKPRCTIDGTVVQVVEDVEKLRVDPGTMVLSSQDHRDALRAAKLGERVRLKVAVDGFDWRHIDEVVGGGPELLREGRDVAPTKGEFNEARHPRTIVGRDDKGALWFVAIDGRQKQSLGASLPEAAALMKSLGCVQAMNLDGGGSTTMNLFGVTLNRPSGGVQRAIGNAVLWFGPRPQSTSVPLRIALGPDARLSLVDGANRPFASDRVIWSAQGKAWIDGDGRLYPLETGETTVRALLDGRVYEAKFTLKGIGTLTIDPD